MDQFIKDEVLNPASRLSIIKSTDSLTLRQSLTDLEEKWRLKTNGGNVEELLLSLIRTSIEKNNLDLAILIVAKLRLAQLVLLLKSAQSSSVQKEANNFIAFSYLINYFRFKDVKLELVEVLREKTSQQPTLFGQRRVIEFYINQSQWSAALSHIERVFRDHHQGRTLNRQLVINELAEQCEVEEDFLESLRNYEDSNALHFGEEIIRLILKNRLDAAFDELRNYLNSSRYSQSLEFYKIFARFLVATGNLTEANEVHEKHGGDLASFVKMNWRSNVELVETRVLGLLPERVVKFLKGNGNQGIEEIETSWLRKRNVDLAFSVLSSLDGQLRAACGELAHQYQLAKWNSKACGFYLCLNQFEAATLLKPAPLFGGGGLIGRKRLHLASCYGSSSLLMPILIDQFFQDQEDSKSTIRNDQEDEGLFSACLKLGLIDEALQALALNSVKLESNLNRAIDILSNKSQEQLDYIDPRVERSSLDLLIQFFSGHEERMLSTNVITTVILTIRIFILKLEPNQEYLVEEIFKLEQMFHYLSEMMLKKLPFNGTDCLIKATSALVLALKEKLEILRESELIRESFRQLTELIANRCMIESQYKSAAMLYSHIEDNVSAIKCLMRMGDVDMVINYALLVRDITVNRLTINYLKHLGVDGAMLEDFITKIRQQQQQ